MMQLVSKAAPAIARHHYSGKAHADVDWKTRAIADFNQHGARHVALLMAGVIHGLTDQQISPEQVWVSPDQRAAAVTVDGVRFRWEQNQLVVLRPCAHCGLGQLASPPIHSRADLGYALAVWQPCHADCAPEDPADWS